MKTIKPEELNEIIYKHELWLRNDPAGERAIFEGVDLINADFYCANLSRATFEGVNLFGANFEAANLCEAEFIASLLVETNFRRANLARAHIHRSICDGSNFSNVNLTGANLTHSNFASVDFYSADFKFARLRDPDLHKALLDKAINLDSTDGLTYPMACPEEGSFIGFKKARSVEYDARGLRRHVIVKLQIPKNAKRSSATTAKCRCSKAKVLSITNLDGSDSGETMAMSIHDKNFLYVVGGTVSVKDFDDNRWVECAPGIHFFTTRQSAVEY